MVLEEGAKSGRAGVYFRTWTEQRACSLGERSWDWQRRAPTGLAGPGSASGRGAGGGEVARGAGRRAGKVQCELTRGTLAAAHEASRGERPRERDPWAAGRRGVSEEGRGAADPQGRAPRGGEQGGEHDWGRGAGSATGAGGRRRRRGWEAGWAAARAPLQPPPPLGRGGRGARRRQLSHCGSRSPQPRSGPGVPPPALLLPPVLLLLLPVSG